MVRGRVPRLRLRLPYGRHATASSRRALSVLRPMWTDELASFDGKHFQLEEAVCEPKPLQRRPAHRGSAAAEEGAAADRGALRRRLELQRQHRRVRRDGEILKGHCRDVGRDFDEIRHHRDGRRHLLRQRRRSSTDFFARIAAQGLPRERLLSTSSRAKAHASSAPSSCAAGSEKGCGRVRLLLQRHRDRSATADRRPRSSSATCFLTCEVVSPARRPVAVRLRAAGRRRSQSEWCRECRPRHRHCRPAPRSERSRAPA